MQYRHNSRVRVIMLTKWGNVMREDIVKRVFEDLHKFDIELNQKLYEQTLEQLYRNFERCKNLDVVIQKSIFILFIKLIEEEFKGKYILTIEKYKELERSIKQRDFAMYKLVCKMM